MDNFVNIEGHPTHWRVLGAQVEETYGPYNAEDQYAYEWLTQALIIATNNKILNLEKDLAHLNYMNRNKIRNKILCWFKKGFRELYNKHQQRIADKQLEYDHFTPDLVKVERLPKVIEIKGTRLAVGQKLYVVDPYTLTLEVFEIEDIELQVYGFVNFELYSPKNKLGRNNSKLMSSNVKPEDFVVNSTYYFHSLARAYNFVVDKLDDVRTDIERVYQENE